MIYFYLLLYLRLVLGRGYKSVPPFQKPTKQMHTRDTGAGLLSQTIDQARQGSWDCGT